jgi:NAD(P)-dependent dehydrogenase (short-subunit alcohol dehydrogenase family)
MKRVALITGAAQGVGQAIAERLANAGFDIVVADIDGEAAETAARKISAAGAAAGSLRVDVADEPSVALAYAEIERRHGRLDVLINNAGVTGLKPGERSPIETLAPASWQHALKVNLSGTFLMSRGAIPLMRRGAFGRIVNISSRSGRSRTGLHDASYATTKAALLGLSRVLAGEVGASGITVNCVAPSRVATPLTTAIVAAQPDYFDHAIAESAVGRIGTPADIAEAVAFLCSDEAGFITGTVLDVNGGSFMP